MGGVADQLDDEFESLLVDPFSGMALRLLASSFSPAAATDEAEPCSYGGVRGEGEGAVASRVTACWIPVMALRCSGRS